jgi:hypothetical protein
MSKDWNKTIPQSIINIYQIDIKKRQQKGIRFAYKTGNIPGDNDFKIIIDNLDRLETEARELYEKHLQNFLEA